MIRKKLDKSKVFESGEEFWIIEFIFSQQHPPNVRPKA
uniref:Uncharacterized protein n=1 Tax=Manihot esculenta TaxID=3983 RepID=A0A2C9VU14_MANES